MDFVALRKEAGYKTQQRLADVSKVSVDTVSNIERGMVQYARYDTVESLATALNTTPANVAAAIAASFARAKDAAAQEKTA